ncbi:hypothetical protein D5086_017296 [Populus alba]|uniref:Uncharacterized protein n=1 Tax=Populus alba TaxID=43335 RepID=A0ACC4BWP4_POPAL
MFAGFTFIAGLLPLVGKPVLDSGYFCGLLLMLDVTCCYDGWGLLIGLFLRCFAIGDYSSSYFALFWEACSLLRALFGSVAVDAGLIWWFWSQSKSSTLRDCEQLREGELIDKERLDGLAGSGGALNENSVTDLMDLWAPLCLECCWRVLLDLSELANWFKREEVAGSIRSFLRPMCIEAEEG